MGVGAQKHGLLPINQHAMHFQGKIAYHNFGGFEFDIKQREPLLRDLGDKKVAILRNHGSLVCGPTIGAAMVQHHQLEIACQGQIAALTAGRDQIVLISKGGHTPYNTPADVNKQVLESLDRLGTDHADLYILHRDNLDVPVGEFVTLLNEHQRAGRFRAFARH